MKNIIISLFVLSACKFTPYNGSDIYNHKANLAIDEAPHLKNSLEWWYFTGHLEDLLGREYGIEYVFFHFNPRNKSDYTMVNFALTDPSGEKFYFDYNIDKPDSLLQPVIPVNLKSAKQKGNYQMSGYAGQYHLLARMNEHKIGIDLTTNRDKPILMHNETGYENYSGYTSAGYYSYPRLTTSGVLYVNGDSLQVSGDLWYDRQWNCIGVFQKKVAWDWISLQIDKPKSELMVYRLYHLGEDAVIYGGSYLDEYGNNVHLEPNDVHIEEIEYWKSEESGIRYPKKWKINVEKLDLGVVVASKIPDQELTIKFSPLHKMYYWEGMCSVKGIIGEKEITGKSYVEITNRNALNNYAGKFDQ